MIDIEKYNSILEYLRNNLKQNRYIHSLSVAYTAMSLANYYKENKFDAFFAGLLHDIAKQYDEDCMIKKCINYGITLSEDDKKANGILHCYVGAYEAKKLFNINNNIFDAIYTHTLGDINMTMLQKIIFVADFIEPMRDFDEDITDIIKCAYFDIDKCMYLIYENIIYYLKLKNKYMHKKTIEVYNYLKNKYGK